MNKLQTATETLPTVRIERAVEAIDPNILDKFVADVGAFGARALLGNESKILLLRPEETLLHYRVAREAPSVDEIDTLGDYLEDLLPSELDDPLTIPMRPVSEFHYMQSPGKGKGRRRPGSLFISGRENEQVLRERTIVRELLADYFSYTDRQRLSITRHISDDKTGIYLASVRSEPKIEAVRDAFQTGEIDMPETATLKRAVITDI